MGIFFLTTITGDSRHAKIIRDVNSCLKELSGAKSIG